MASAGNPIFACVLLAKDLMFSWAQDFRGLGAKGKTAFGGLGLRSLRLFAGLHGSSLGRGREG